MGESRRKLPGCAGEVNAIPFAPALLTTEGTVSEGTKLPPAVSGALEALGMGQEHPVTRMVVPALLRGNHAVLAVPPAPVYAAPGLAAALALAGFDPSPGFALVLAPDGAAEAWASFAARLAPALGRAVAFAAGPGRAGRLAHAPETAGLVASPETIAALQTRGGLPLDRIRALVLVWPELLASDEALVPLFNELPRTVPRLIVTTDPEGTAPLAERYAWRAVVAGPLAGATVAAPAAFRARVAPVQWHDRLSALGDLVDLEDADTITVWAASPSDHPQIRAGLRARGIDPLVTNHVPEGATLVACYDVPPPETLRDLAARGAVFLLPPGSEPYAARWIAHQQPVRLPGPLDAAQAAMADERRLVRARIDGGDDRAALATLAPLFERYPATAVAAALHALWTDARHRAEPVVHTGSAPGGRRARVWVNAGRKDGVTLGEWLSFLTSEIDVPRETVGRVDLKETFTLIEFAGELEAQHAVDRLAGRTLRGRRLAARLDRGREARAP
jgi:DbpA RNA binding domain